MSFHTIPLKFYINHWLCYNTWPSTTKNNKESIVSRIHFCSIGLLTKKILWRDEKKNVLLQGEYKNLSDILKDMHIGEKVKKNLCGNCKNMKKINFILKESITWKRSTGKEEMTLYPQKSLPNICQQCQQED